MMGHYWYYLQIRMTAVRQSDYRGDAKVYLG